MKHWQCAVVYGALVAAFTGYVMLDTFLLPSMQTTAVSVNTSMFADVQADTLPPEETTETTTETASTESAASAETSENSHRGRKHSRSEENRTQAAPEASVTESAPEETAENSGNAVTSGTTYENENARITLTQYREYGTDIYVADVQLSSAQYLETAFADDLYGKNVTAATSDIADAHDAVLAINGDFYGAREQGIVIRNGVVYRDGGDADTDVLCVYADGHFGITNAAESDAQSLVESGVWQAFSFGPALVEDGNIAVSTSAEVAQSMQSNPRTAIGMIEPLHYVFVVSDGRTDASEGLSLYQLGEFMQSLGVQTAYNLDGGGSTTMYFQGQVVNNPTTNGRSFKERKVSDIVYIGS